MITEIPNDIWATITAAWKGFDVNLLFQGGGGFNVIYFEQLQYPLCFSGNGLAHFYDRYHQDENETGFRNGRQPVMRILWNKLCKM